MNDREPDRRPEMRAGDVERDEVAARLAAALEEGRLDLTEYDQRLEQAMQAKTIGELDRIVADLPIPQAQRRKEQELAEARRKQAARRALLERWRTWFAFALMFNLIWLFTVLASGELVGYWPAIPLGIWAAINLASGLGGDRDDGA